MSLKNSIIMLWVYVMYGLGMWMFFSGYLLKRIVVHKHNSEISNLCHLVKCQEYDSLHNITDIFTGSSNTTTANYNSLKRFDKAVIVLIDALRYDFTVPQNSSGSHYLNQMTVFSDIARTSPERCLWSELLADPPTTTLQRLTGLTTGSLPTFVDISMNFASSDIREDNIIQQLHNLGKKVVFLGDDTWEGLFPNHFHRSFPFPSFNVKDLDTVDKGILNHIYKELEKPDWDVIIAHFLGVDHCGHRYGPNHPAMASKLHQMDAMIRNITKQIKDGTLLVVLGDHGMTQSGDHGGDSSNEITTTLFLYSHSNLSTESKIGALNSSVLQIDLVPTLSLLLGFPIPFSNLGSTLTQLFSANSFSSRKSCFGDKIDHEVGAALAAAENAHQVNQYLTEYATVSQDFPPSTLAEAKSLLRNISQLWKNIRGDNSDHETLRTLVDGYGKYLKFIQLECKSKWAKFNIENMIAGGLILLASVIINLTFAQSITIKVFSAKVFIVTVIVVLIGITVYLQNPYFFILYCVVTQFILCLYLRRQRNRIFQHLLKLLTVPNIVILLITCSNLSNSYVVHEDRMTLFLLQTLIVYKFYPPISAHFTSTAEKNKKSKSNRKTTSITVWIPPCLLVCLMVLIRLSSVFRKCREEQVLCETSLFLTSLESVSSPTSSYHIMRLCLSWFSIAIPVIAVVVVMKYMHRETNYSAASICVNYGLTSAAICICLHWWLSVVSPEVLDRILGQNQVIAARTALVMSVLVFTSMWIMPLLPEKPLECPTNRIFIGSLTVFIFSVLLPLYLMAGDGLSPAMFLMVVTLVILLTLNSFLDNPDCSQDAIAVIWAISSYHWFYSTGHQPTFPSLHWDAAFVVSKEVVSHLLAGAFVTMNTFSSQIVHGITLPLLLLSTNSPKLPTTPIFLLVLKYLSIPGFKLVGSALSCFLLRRHLMVWKIFTPKLIYETLGLGVTAISVLIGYLFVLRVIDCLHRQIKKNADQLWVLKDE